MTTEQVLGLITAVVTSAGFQTALALAAGWALKVGFDVLVAAIRARSMLDVELAELALKRAVGTPEKQDDAVAEMALARAHANQAFLERLASAIEKAKPPGIPGASNR